MIDPSTIGSVYSGKAGRCCCGCSGRHMLRRRDITRICRIIDALGPTSERFGFTATDTHGHYYIAYLLDQPPVAANDDIARRWRAVQRGEAANP